MELACAWDVDATEGIWGVVTIVGVWWTTATVGVFVESEFEVSDTVKRRHISCGGKFGIGESCIT